jgi:proteasome lid subunit RPN8/RPN11
MLHEVQARLPEEACGVLLGRGSQVLEAVAVTNVLHSPLRYRMDEREQLALFLRLEAEALDLVAIYHSHPTGPPTPSPTDTAEAYYPEAVYLVWSPLEGGWSCRGFILQDGQFQEIPLVHLD